jgi:hypothetical protein
MSNPSGLKDQDGPARTRDLSLGRDYKRTVRRLLSLDLLGWRKNADARLGTSLGGEFGVSRAVLCEQTGTELAGGFRGTRRLA